MNKQYKVKLSFYKVACFMFVLVCCFLSLIGNLFYDTTNRVYAENNVYSNVLIDLEIDKSFNAEDFPFVEDDYTLQVIQIAESVNNELFVYVYQPSADTKNLLATSINISTEIRNRLSYKNYDLTLLNSNGVFYKFKVDNFEIKEDDVRYYDISNIYRNWNEEIDADSENDNTVSEEGFDVGKLYSVTGHGDNIVYLVKDTDFVTITDKFVGFVRYPDGFHLIYDTDKSCDSHFVAFSTDKDIDKLYEAQVFFTQQSSSYMLVTYPYVDSYQLFGEKEKTYVELDYTQKGSWESSGWGSHKYSWTRISDVDTFFNETDRDYIYNIGLFDVREEIKINSASETAIRSKQWVLRFAETDYVYTNNGNIVEKKTIVGDVSILRLKFEKDGIVYNLGVVDNKQTGSENPVNTVNKSVHIAKWLKDLIISIVTIICAVALGLLINFLCPWFWPLVFSILWKVFCIFCKALWWVITSPFALFFD